MEEYKEIIMSLYLGGLILIFYIIMYLLYGKEKGVKPFFKVLSSCFMMYISVLIPIMLIVTRWTRIEPNDYMAGIFIDIFSIVFSVPFFSELIESISRDFGVSEEFKNNFLYVIAYLAVGGFLGLMLIFFTAGYLAGEVSIMAVLGILYMIVVMISFIVSNRLKNKYAYDNNMLEKIKRVEKKEGIVLIIIMVIFFIIIMIS